MRPTLDAWGLALAVIVARRSTCARRAVGCVLMDGAGHIIATGYNGVVVGAPHCNEGTPCPGALGHPSGVGLDACQAVHAEQNALLQCTDPRRIATAYMTVSPCVTCTKLLLNTTCRRMVAAEAYAHDAAAHALWERAGRAWEIAPNVAST